MKYRLDVKRDVDHEQGSFSDDYILTLPYGWRFYDDLVHVRGYDTMAELRESAHKDVIVCDCHDCTKHK